MDIGTRAREHAPVSESTVPGRAGSRGRVLVVDDEPFVVKIAQRVLERDGVEVLTAADGEQTLAVLGKNAHISLILLDSSLPDMNAEQVLEVMRDRGFGTPVLLSSGFGAESVPTSQQFANVCGFLAKPYSVAQLSEKVREMLEGGS